MRARALLVAGFVALVVLLFVWAMGPTLFAESDAAEERVVTATVTRAVPCDKAGATETVRLQFAGAPRAATLNACGHDKGEELEVAVPVNAGTGALTVRAADTAVGNHDLRKPLGLLLVALSCLGGGTYAFLVTRGSSRPSHRAVRAA